MKNSKAGNRMSNPAEPEIPVVRVITLEQAHRLLEECSAVSLEDSEPFYPSMSDLTGEDDNLFAYLGWENEGQDYSLQFTEGQNRLVTLVGNLITLTDHEGDDVNIYLLGNFDTEKFLSQMDGSETTHKASQQLPIGHKLEDFIKHQEKLFVLATLKHNDYHREKTAVMLGVSLATLYRKLEIKQGISKILNS